VNLTDQEREAIRHSFARLLAQRCTEANVRRVMVTPDGYDADLWRQMAEMGILGLLIDPEFGGVGAGARELELIMEEAGAALLPGPLLSSSVLAASLLSDCSDDALKREMLPGLADGSRIATVALTGDAGSWTNDGVEVRAERGDGGWTLTGSASFVTWANVADTLLVLARTANGTAVFIAGSGDDGVGIEPLDTQDPTLRLARATFERAPAVLLPGVGETSIERALTLARIALAGEQAGGARRVLDGTVDYLKTRRQFGRPIGGFQALKHMAADLLLEVESATSAAREAARAYAESTSAAEIDALISLAGFACADAFKETSATGIQMHGGIAFTWEHWAHLYWRRARTGAVLFGSSDGYRDRYLAAREKMA
jgi:alkylation response protein AidB-like acyl-CoA dehydrogenase